jgi:hypothetical protein
MGDRTICSKIGAIVPEVTGHAGVNTPKMAIDDEGSRL